MVAVLLALAAAAQAASVAAPLDLIDNLQVLINLIIHQLSQFLSCSNPGVVDQPRGGRSEDEEEHRRMGQGV